MDRPRIAYVTLWFPKASETFVFREVKVLGELGLPLTVCTLYGDLDQPLSPEMRAFPAPERLGSRAAARLLAAFFSELVRNPRHTLSLAHRCLGPGFGTLERFGENLWGFFAGFALAGRFRDLGITHAHAPWAGGAAMAAWVASELTGIPFSFAARAGDIHPPEPALARKTAAAAFVRVNNAANAVYLRSFAGDAPDKVALVYNCLSLAPERGKSGERAPGPVRFLAAGRFVATKGFSHLLDACALLRGRGLDFRLVLAGDGALGPGLRRQVRRLGLEDRVDLPGFLSHDALSAAMLRADALVMPCVVDRDGDRDGIPNVIMEALAHGLAVAATDVAGIPEVVRPDTGWLVPQADVPALALALEEIAADLPEAERRARAGQRLVHELFDPRANAQKLAALFAVHSRGAR